MTLSLTYPFAASSVRRLKVGDRVLVFGRVFTGRDRLHAHLAAGRPVPVELRRGALYHCGPVMVRRRGVWRAAAAGPTTSIREEPYMADIIRRYGLAVIIGKGGMGEATRRACRRHDCVYLHAVGGAAQVLADAIRRVNGVHFLGRFGPTEALWDLEVEALPCLVTLDASGASLHERVMRRAERRRARLLKPARGRKMRRARPGGAARPSGP